jgi:DNA polymerase bacteriophage-type
LDKVTLDIETFSRCDLKKAGAARYAEDESTDINCACWAAGDGPVNAWIPAADIEFLEALYKTKEIDGVSYGGEDPPSALTQAIVSGGPGALAAWNAAFERSVLNGPAGRRYDFPRIEIEQTYCSMGNARVHGLPGALEDAANAINAPHKKRIAGVNDMRYLAKPRKNGSRPVLSEERERFLRLVGYCADDVRAERSVDRIVPPMSSVELAVYHLDQEMNDRGWKVDLEAVDSMEILIAEYKRELLSLCVRKTGVKPSQHAQLAQWIRSHGFPELENLQADTVRKVLLLNIPEEVKEVLKIYSTYGMKAVAKYPAMRLAVGKGNRLRHLFMFYGAGTGRWSSVIVQLQNLFRPVIKDPETALLAAQTWDLGYLRALFAGVDPMKVMASCVRSCLIADEGKELVFPDYAGVEARWNAWMFGEEWKLKVFRDYDAGIGPNNYAVVYARSFGVPVETVKKDTIEYLLGKCMDLYLGYEGGVAAFIKGCATYRVDLKRLLAAYDTLPVDIVLEAQDAWRYACESGRTYDLDEKLWVTCEGLKRLWRRAHPKIVKGWKDLKEAALAAVANPGEIRAVANKRLMFKVEGKYLLLRLPSGRKLWYYSPQIRDETVYYLGMDTVKRVWGLTNGYGGKWCENETQAGCRDILVASKFKFRDAGFDLIGSIHDQPVLEVPVGALSDETVKRIMCKEAPSWCEGLPLAVEVQRGQRFRK